MENQDQAPQPAPNPSGDLRAQPSSSAAADSDDYVDDMRDTPTEIEKTYRKLPLSACTSLLGAHMVPDKAAIEFQSSHVNHTRAAALFGTVAVLAAIAELALSYNECAASWKRGWALVEFVCVAVAVISALHGRFAQKKEKWLAQRHQAELYRQLKFKLLIHPKVWSDAAWREQEVQRIARITSRSSLEQAIEGPPPHSPVEIEEQSLDWTTLKQLVEYYFAKRLNPQKEYLANRALRNQYKDIFLRWPDLLFFASVGAAGVHFIFFVLENPTLFGLPQFAPKGIEDLVFRIGLGLLLAAAGLPVIAAGARTWRAAFEFSRNKSRFRSAHAALEQVEISLLHDALEGPPADPAQVADRSLKVLRELWWAEHILCNEHQEWLRLMLETEWYG